MTQHRTRRTESQWQELIEQWQASGLSGKQFCQEQGVGYASFCKWRKRLAGGMAAPEPSVNFIDVGGLTGSSHTGWNIILHLGDGVELRLSRS